MSDTMFLPFQYRPSRIECDNTIVSNTAAEINRLRTRGALTALDLEILKAISQYRYLNKHNLTSLLQADPTLSGAERDANLKNRLAKLAKNGLVLRHYFLVEGETRQTVPYFYTLSRGAAAYIKRTGMSDFSIEDILTLESPERVMLQLAFNQAVIQLIRKAKGNPRLNVTAKAPTLKKKFQLYGYVTVSGPDGPLPILFEPIRRFPTWESYLTTRSAYLTDYLAIAMGIRKSPFPNPPLVVFVCEDDTHVQECHRVLANCPLQPVYTCDARLMDDDLSASFVGCREEGDAITLIRFKPSFQLSSCQNAIE